MSSPIASNKKSFFKNALISFHQKVSHNNRINILVNEFNQLVKKIFPDEESVHLLDVGCGDMSLVEKMSENDSRIDPTCIDIYPLPKNLVGDQRWNKYYNFDGKNIPFPDNKFDLVILSDVLHHDFNNSYNLLKESARVGKYILLKDHFEYGLYSRTMLKVMDIVGNWGYGVSIPKKYFTKKEYYNLISNIGLTEIVSIPKVELYSHSFILSKMLKSDWQFISVLKK